MADVSIYWFRDDLRLSDLPGLQAAADRGAVIPVYIFDEKLVLVGEDGALANFVFFFSLHPQ